jgi:glycosyltransferase involved in cell wall biosynthesis
VRKLNIAYVSASDPRDKKVWSGTHNTVFNTIDKNVGNVVPLGPYRPFFATFIGKSLSFLSKILFKKRYNYRHSRLLAISYANYFNRILKKGNFDLIVAPAALCELAYIKTDIPIIYISDATIQLSLNYHKSLTGLLSYSEKETLKIEQLAYEICDKIIVSSDWALKSLIEEYKIPADRIMNLPFGANMCLLPEAKDLSNKFTGDTCRLLFIGVYWESKGGDIAFNCLIELLNLGIDAELTICGCIPPEEFRHEKMKIIPFIDKNSPDGMSKLYDIFLQHDFLILPTRFDCTPIVICEASAFAIPCFVANTGGVAGHLSEGKNGYLIDYNDTGKGYAQKIAEVFTDKEKFNLLKKTSREEFDNRLNWDIYGEKLKMIIDAILSNE